MAEQNTEKLDALRKDVVELVTEHWQTNKKAYLLSRLGQTLIRRGFDLQEILAGRKLAAYISTELKDALRVLSPRSNSLMIGAIPVNADVSGGIDTLFTPPSKPAGGESHVPILIPAFWAAFTRPIPTGRVRTLSLAPKVQFQDVSEAAATQSGKMTVARELVVSPDSVSNGDYKTAVYSSIQRWLEANGIELKSVLASSSPPGSAAQMARTDTADGRAASGSLLEQVLAALTDDEKRRISLPLDIVARLARV